MIRPPASAVFMVVNTLVSTMAVVAMWMLISAHWQWDMGFTKING